MTMFARSIEGGAGGQHPINRLLIQARLRVLIAVGSLPPTMPRRMFVGRCLETHSCVACGVDIHTHEHEFEWTNPAGLVAYFHRHCAEIYRTLSRKPGTT
jgi:hypothetical protein